MIDQLLASLRSVNLQPTPEELAEALWLAQFLPPAIKSVEPASAPPPAKQERPQTQEPTASEPEPQQPPPTPAAASPEQPAGAKLVRPEISREGAAGVVEGSLVRAPAAGALPHTLKLGHAFRPLRRRVPSRTRVVLDESATVYQVAETQGRLWNPIFAPALTRWMELALVVDGSASMAVWTQTISELERLLQRLGAFSDVRRWTLGTEDPRAVRLYAGRATPATRTARPLRELIDPTGRRLVLVVSDCIAPAWNTGAVMQALGEWGRTGPVALMQVLPQRLWVRTSLGSAVRSPLHARASGVSNMYLEPEPWVRGRQGVAPRGLPMPVFPLDPPTIKEWARMVAGGGKTSLGLVLPPAPWDASDAGTSAESSLEGGPALPDAATIIQDFQGTASPLAQELASYLAAAPLYLPAMRLVQRVMLPQARQVHLAEVLLGGLLREVKREGQPSWGGETWYEFHPGVRERLLDSLKRGSSLEVLRQVSDFLGVRFGQGRDFAAALVAPDGELQLDAAEANEPFAMVAATVLRRLGGRYTRFAERLQSKAPGPVSQLREEVSQESTPPPSKVPAAADEEGRIRQACALVSSDSFLATAYLIGPRRFITSADGLRGVGTGDRVRVLSALRWHEATVLSTDFQSDCAVVEVDDALDGITPLELEEETRGSEAVEVYGVLGYDHTRRDELVLWKRAGKVMNVRSGDAPGGDSLVLSLADNRWEVESRGGTLVLREGRVVGHATTLSWESATGPLQRMCSAQQVRRLLSVKDWKPRGQRVLVVGTGDNVERLTPEFSWICEALGERLAREGYGLVGGGWPGVDELVGRAYLASLRFVGAEPEELFLQVLEAGKRPILNDGMIQLTTSWADDALRSAEAVVLIGGEGFTRELSDRARAEGKPVFPLPGLGGDAAAAYKSILRNWRQSSYGGLTRVDMEALDLPCTSRAEAGLLAHRAVTLVTRALATSLRRPAEFAKAMLELLFATEPEFFEPVLSPRLESPWVRYAQSLMESFEDAGTGGEYLGSLVASGHKQESQRYDAIAALRRLLPDARPALLKEFVTIGQVEERGDVKWRLLAQLAPLVLETPEEGLATVSTVLKETRAEGPDEYIEAILHAVEEQFEDSARFRRWLFETLGDRAWASNPVPSTFSLLALSKEFQRGREDDAQRALVALREELSQMSPRSWTARLPAWLESGDDAKRLLAYVLIQLHPVEEAFNGLVRHLKTAFGPRALPVDPRMFEVLLTTLMLVVEAAEIPGDKRLEVEEAIRHELGQHPDRWPHSRDERPMGHLHMLQVLCGLTTRTMKGLVLIGSQLVVIGSALQRSPRRWTISIDKVQSGDVRGWKSFGEAFKKLPPHERFVAFDQEAHLVKRGMSAKKSSRWQLSFEVAEPLPSTTFIAGGERVSDFVARALSRAFGEVQLWTRLSKVASQHPVTQSWALMLNNLLRLEGIRLAALPAHALDFQSQRTGFGCIDRVWNIFALRNRSEMIFEVGVVLNIRGYGPWAGIVPLTQESPLPLK